MTAAQACSLPCPQCNNEDRFGRPDCSFCKSRGLVGNAATWAGTPVAHVAGCLHMPEPVDGSPAEVDKAREFSHAADPYWEPKPRPDPYVPLRALQNVDLPDGFW